MRGVHVNRAHEVHVPVLQDDVVVFLDDLVDVLIVRPPEENVRRIALDCGVIEALIIFFRGDCSRRGRFGSSTRTAWSPTARTPGSAGPSAPRPARRATWSAAAGPELRHPRAFQIGTPTRQARRPRVRRDRAGSRDGSGRSESRHVVIAADLDSVLAGERRQHADVLFAACRCALDRHVPAHRKQVDGPAQSHQGNARRELTAPRRRRPVGSPHVEIDVRVRIHELELGDDAIEDDRLVEIKMRRRRMVCGCRHDKAASENRHEKGKA